MARRGGPGRPFVKTVTEITPVFSPVNGLSCRTGPSRLASRATSMEWQRMFRPPARTIMGS